MHLLTAALEELSSTSESLDLLCNRRMTADGVQDHAHRVAQAETAAKLAIYKALTALVSMDSKAPIEIPIMLKDID